MRTLIELSNKVLLAIITLASSLLFAEVGFRVLGPQGGEFVLDATLGFFDPSLYLRDETLISRPAPNADVEIQAIEYTTRVQTNSLGIRGSEIQRKSEDELRVLAIGDSFTLATQVQQEETFTELLEPLLRERLGRRVTVYNAGVDGYGTQQAIGWMDRLLQKVEPDAILLTFYTGNDLRDNARLPQRLMGELPSESPPPVELTPQERAFQSKLARHFTMYAFLKRHLALRSMADDFRIQEYRDEILPFTDEGSLERLIPATEMVLERFWQRCQSLQLQCMVALAPPAYVIDTQRTPATFRAFGLDPSLARLDIPAHTVAKSAPDELTVIDLAPALREPRTQDTLYYTFDPHWTPAGHEVVSQALVEPLVDVIWAPHRKP
ncbi:MAG: SGNH/GDSL hydrolase family protein [Myxococcota bacterium]|nr:SGNH/GDSL hydrolase family protein [Myxococcota bacterium]